MDSLIAGEKEITPYIPYFLRDGNSITEQWTEVFDDKQGHTGVMTMLRFKNAKGKVSEPLMRYIIWDKK